jgi:DNA repair protein RecO (recombination protein O)
VVIPGNIVAAEIRAKSDSQLPFARLELSVSRGPWLSEPLPSAAIAWACAVTAATLPERNPYPALHAALGALLDAVCHAPSARGWVEALIGYETLLLREAGYGGSATTRPEIADLGRGLEILDRLEGPIATYLIADMRADVMAARRQLRDRLARILA